MKEISNVIFSILIFSLPFTVYGQQNIFELQIAPKINLDRIEGVQKTIRPVSNISLGYYYMPDSMNIGIGLQGEYFTERYNTISSILKFRYYAIKLPLFIQSRLSNKLFINIKAGPALYFPFMVNTNLTRLFRATDKESGKVGIHSALTLVFKRQRAVNYGISVLYNSVLGNTLLYIDSEPVANQYTFSHVSIALTAQIRFNNE